VSFSQWLSSKRDTQFSIEQDAVSLYLVQIIKVPIQVSPLLDSSLPTAVRQGFCVGAGGAAAGGTARTHAKPG